YYVFVLELFCFYVFLFYFLLIFLFFIFFFFFFFFKQKTAYEMPKRLEFRRVLFRSRVSRPRAGEQFALRLRHALDGPTALDMRRADVGDDAHVGGRDLLEERDLAAMIHPHLDDQHQIGRASCRESVYISEVAE